jgi:hypothetical protein
MDLHLFIYLFIYYFLGNLVFKAKVVILHNKEGSRCRKNGDPPLEDLVNSGYKPIIWSVTKTLAKNKG